MFDSQSLYTPLKRDTSLTDRVEAQLEALVMERRLKAGDRLPAERELAQGLGVSRTVVREAVRALVAKGLLEVRNGSGTYVQAYTSINAAASFGRLIRLTGKLDDTNATLIHEVRRPLEVAIAGHAAERATADDLVELTAWVEAIQQPHDDVQHYVDADVAFHRALARATHNELFLVLLDAMSDVMHVIREVGYGVSGSTASAIYYHRSLCEQIAAHDVAGAQRVMTAHMDDSERIFNLGMEKALQPA